MKEEKNTTAAVPVPALLPALNFSPLDPNYPSTPLPASPTNVDFSPFGIGRGQINKLHNAAVQGDADAARDLVELADYAASVLNWVWDGLNFSIASPNFERAREAQREMLRRIAEKRETWPVLYRRRMAYKKRTDQMAKQLRLGTAPPLKAIGVSDGDMRFLIETLLSYEIGTPPADNVKEWIDKAMNFIEKNFHDELYEGKTFLYCLANPKRQVKKRRKKARDRLNKWEGKMKSQHESGKLSIEETEYKAAWLRRIRRNARVTENELRYGLREALTAALKSLIPKSPQI